MRVVCIYDKEQFNGPNSPPLPNVKKGCIYTVVEIQDEPYEEFDHCYCEAGKYYVLAETGEETLYHESMFIPIIDNQQDEKEMEREWMLTPVELPNQIN